MINHRIWYITTNKIQALNYHRVWYITTIGFDRIWHINHHIIMSRKRIIINHPGCNRGTSPQAPLFSNAARRAARSAAGSLAAGAPLPPRALAGQQCNICKCTCVCPYIYIHTNVCVCAILCDTNTYRWTCICLKQNNKIYMSFCIHIHIYIYIHSFKHLYSSICISICAFISQYHIRMSFGSGGQATSYLIGGSLASFLNSLSIKYQKQEAPIHKQIIYTLW